MIIGTTHRLVPVYYAMEGCGMYSKVGKKEYSKLSEETKEKYIITHYDIEEIVEIEFFDTPD